MTVTTNKFTYPAIGLALLLLLTACPKRDIARSGPAVDLQSLISKLERLENVNPVFVTIPFRQRVEAMGYFVPVREEMEIRKALINPSYWRQLDREHRFGTVVLVGQTDTVQILLRHFMDSEDWKLTGLFAGGLILQRYPEVPWTAGELFAADGELDSSEQVAEDTAFGIAQWLLEAGDPETAGRVIEDFGNDKSADWLILEARREADLKNWDDVLRISDDVLEQSPDNDAAMVLKAQSLLNRGAGKMAWQVTGRLVDLYPDNGQYLFLHANASRAANVYGDEVDALEKLLAMAEESGTPSGAYRVYLGQAYSAARMPDKALEAFRAAAADPSLPESQQGFVYKAIERLEEK